jgi:hypothetical protein
MTPSGKAPTRFCLWLLPPVWLGFAVGLWQRRASLPLVYQMALCGLGMGGVALVLGLALGHLLSGSALVPPSGPAPSVFVDTGALAPTGTGIITATSQRPAQTFVGTGLALGTSAWTCTDGDRLVVTRGELLFCESGPPGRE